MPEVTHHTVEANGIRMHVAEQGGPASAGRTHSRGPRRVTRPPRTCAFASSAR
jgi:hypothetical protein